MFAPLGGMVWLHRPRTVTWFQCARLALKEPETGDLMIVGDGSQSLYRKRDFTWADAGIHASGRVINRELDLDRNYRNTVEILRAARAFSVPPGSGLQGVLALPVEPDTAIRSGPEPWLIRLDDAASEMHYAALIETWLRGSLEIGGRRQRVKPADIAVLYPRRRAAVIGAMQSNTLLAPTLHWIATVRGRSMTHIWRAQSG